MDYNSKLSTSPYLPIAIFHYTQLACRHDSILYIPFQKVSDLETSRANSYCMSHSLNSFQSLVQMPLRQSTNIIITLGDK